MRKSREQIVQKLADLTVKVAKMRSDPVVEKYLKLESFAESVGLSLKVVGEKFVIYNETGKKLLRCETTGEVNDWFRDNYMEEVL